MSINNLYHIREKAMWGGSSKKGSIDTLMTFNVDDDKKTIAPRSVRLSMIPESILKCYDELIVNAVDHIATCRAEDRTRQVSRIDIRFDHDTLAFTIENDGKGIDISTFPANDENFPGAWKPYVFFTEEKQGTNAFKEIECVKAGVNGYGSKIVLAHSAEMIVRCYNADQGMTYEHTHRNDPKTGKYVLGKPIVKANASLRTSKTFVSFTQITEGPAAPKKQVYGIDIHLWIIYRLVYIAAYINMLVKTFKVRQPRLVYVSIDDGVEKTYDLSWITFADIAESMKKPKSSIVSFTIQPTTETVIVDEEKVSLYPLDVTFCLKGVNMKTGVISNTNGTLIEDGAHLKGLFDQIADGVTKKIVSKIKNNEIKITSLNVTNNCIMFVNAILPGLEFGEQAKIKAKVDSAIVNSYKIGTTLLKKITDMMIKDVILECSDKMDKRLSKKVNISDKYEDAASRSRNRSDFTLVIIEGDSAKSAIVAGMSSLKGTYDIDKMGYMTLHGGVPNSRKKSMIITDDDGNEHVILDGMSMNNMFLNTLQKALGIKVGVDVDRDKLRYGRVVCCVDQDHDGKGKLFGLIMNIFAYFWPELLDGTFLYKLESPIVRVYPSKAASKKLEKASKRASEKALATFYYDYQMEDFAMKPSYEVKYYKGLGSYSAAEMRLQCANFFNNLRAIRMDSKGWEMIEEYYGIDTAPRKRILSNTGEYAMQFYKNREKAIRGMAKKRETTNGKTETRVATMNNVIATTPTYKISDYLSSDVFLFAKDDIMRKLPNAIDGFNDSGRKIVNALLNRRSNRRMKVVELAGYVQESQNYHHNEACLEDNIKGKCFIAVGGKQVPHMIPEGHFGNRLCGGKSAAASRYIFVSPNVSIIDVLYPAADANFLKYTMDDGKTYEPDYLVPIIPMAVIETMSMPSHGWNFFIQGRDIHSVIARVRRMIISEDRSFYRPLPMDTRGFTGDYVFNPYTGEERTIGKYVVYDDRIVITEVPIGRWLTPYRADLCAKIIFYGLDASVGQPNIAEDGSFTLTIHVGDGFWESVERPSGDKREDARGDNSSSSLMTSPSIARFARNSLTEGLVTADEVPAEIHEAIARLPDDKGIVKMTRITKKEIESVFGKDATDLFKRKKKGTAKKTTSKKKTTTDKPIKTALDKYVDADKDDMNDGKDKAAKGTKNGAINIRTIAKGEKYSLSSFLDLEDTHATSLNMIDAAGDVISFGTDYQAVIEYWFAIRKEVYEKRVAREMCLNRLRLAIIVNTIKYCREYDFERRPEGEANDILTDLGIKAINVDAIRHPGTRDNETLEACISDYPEGDNDYEYLWKMSIRDARSQERISRLERDALKMTMENAWYESRARGGRFLGANIWLDEVDTLEKALKEGQAVNWGQ